MESVSPCPSIPGPIKSNEVDELEGSAASFTMKKRESNTSSGASKASALGSSDPNSADQSVNGEIDISKVVLNPLGGGRGYVPGETPDDPKKRHKCEVCGRGFARLFNLKVSVVVVIGVVVVVLTCVCKLPNADFFFTLFLQFVVPSPDARSHAIEAAYMSSRAMLEVVFPFTRS